MCIRDRGNHGTTRVTIGRGRWAIVVGLRENSDTSTRNYWDLLRLTERIHVPLCMYAWNSEKFLKLCKIARHTDCREPPWHCCRELVGETSPPKLGDETRWFHHSTSISPVSTHFELKSTRQNIYILYITSGLSPKSIGPPMLEYGALMKKITWIEVSPMCRDQTPRLGISSVFVGRSQTETRHCHIVR